MQQQQQQRLPDTVSDPVATPENLVCTANVGTQLNLEHMIKSLRAIGGELNRGKFAAIILRFGKEPLYPRATLLVFSSGKMVCTGCKCVEGAILVMSKVVEQIRRRCGIACAELRGFRVQNVVGCLRLNIPIDLDELRLHVLPAASFEPTSFPGVIYKRDRIVFLIFFPGSAVITGATSLEEMQAAARFIAPQLYRARVVPKVTGPSSSGKRKGAPAPTKKLVAVKDEEMEMLLAAERDIVERLKKENGAVYDANYVF